MFHLDSGGVVFPGYYRDQMIMLFVASKEIKLSPLFTSRLLSLFWFEVGRKWFSRGYETVGYITEQAQKILYVFLEN